MGFREVWLMPGAAANCRFRTWKHRNLPENLPQCRLSPGKESLAATFRATGARHPWRATACP